MITTGTWEGKVDSSSSGTDTNWETTDITQDNYTSSSQYGLTDYNSAVYSFYTSQSAQPISQSVSSDPWSQYTAPDTSAIGAPILTSQRASVSSSTSASSAAYASVALPQNSWVPPQAPTTAADCHMGNRTGLNYPAPNFPFAFGISGSILTYGYSFSSAGYGIWLVRRICG